MTALWAVVPAAGAGSRMGGDNPKQFQSLRGHSVLYWSLDALLAHPSVAGCVVALPADHVEGAGVDLPPDPRISICRGGAERADSVAAALDALGAEDGDWVLVHDAARPCLQLADLERLVETVFASGVGAILAAPVTDTLKRAADDARVEATVDRRHLWRAQTPQMFRVGELRAALTAAGAAGHEVTDEASAMELAGHPVQLVEAAAGNIKVTFPADMAMADFWLAQQGKGRESTTANSLKGCR